jgi:hypothetical protein
VHDSLIGTKSLVGLQFSATARPDVCTLQPQYPAITVVAFRSTESSMSWFGEERIYGDVMNWQAQLNGIAADSKYCATVEVHDTFRLET